MDYDKVREIIHFQLSRCIGYGPWEKLSSEKACDTATAAVMEPLWSYLRPDPDFGVCAG